MAPTLEDVEDEDYASSEDEDFIPEAAPAAASASASEDSESEGEDATVTKTAKPAKRKRVSARDEEAEDVGFENSGDEAIIGKGLKKQRRKKRRGEEEDDEGGEGGFVKTRRMAALAEEERAPLADTKNATVDVDALWASMISGRLTKPPSDPLPPPTTDNQPVESSASLSKTAAAAASSLKTIPNTAADDDTVTIHRTYNFAGKVHTETKIVARDSAEAKLYLASNPTPVLAPTSTSPPRRPTKLARRSIFEPLTEPLPQRADLKLGVGTIRERLVVQAKTEKGRRLNTVEKSKMDWAGFVDKSGIREELEVAEKAKGSYMYQKEFLERVEGKREEEARRARLKGMSTT